MDRISELARTISDAFTELSKEVNVVGVGFDSSNQSICVHVYDEQFKKAFPHHYVTQRDCDKYPTQLNCMIGGVNFFTLSQEPYFDNELKEVVNQ